MSLAIFHFMAQKKKTPVDFSLKTLLTTQTGVGLCNGWKKQRWTELWIKGGALQRKIELNCSIVREWSMRIMCSGSHNSLAKILFFFRRAPVPSLTSKKPFLFSKPPIVLLCVGPAFAPPKEKKGREKRKGSSHLPTPPASCQDRAPPLTWQVRPPGELHDVIFYLSSTSVLKLGERFNPINPRQWEIMPWDEWVIFIEVAFLQMLLNSWVYRALF